MKKVGKINGYLRYFLFFNFFFLIYPTFTFEWLSVI